MSDTAAEVPVADTAPVAGDVADPAVVKDVPEAEPAATTEPEAVAEEPAAAEPAPKEEAVAETTTDAGSVAETTPAADADVSMTDAEPVEAKETPAADESSIADEKTNETSEAVPVKKPRVDMASLPTRQYLDQTVVPILLQGLSTLAKERPTDPISYLADYLVKNKTSFATPQD